jgi:DNA-binding NarL/FixJ family response regulator
MRLKPKVACVGALALDRGSISGCYGVGAESRGDRKWLLLTHKASRMYIVQGRKDEVRERTAWKRRSSSPIAVSRRVTDVEPKAAFMLSQSFEEAESKLAVERQMNPPNVIRVLSVDCHHLLREGVATIIKEQPDMRLVSQASTGPEAIQHYRQHRPDITLMEIRLPGMNGIEALTAIRAEFPEARVVILSVFDGDVEVTRAMQAGACGYFLKTTPPDELVEAIRHVHAGKKRIQTALMKQMAEHMGEDGLSARESEVLQLVAAGHRNRDIGKLLFISEETVKVHLRHINEKLGAKDRTHAVVLADRRGIVRLDSDRWARGAGENNTGHRGMTV